MGEGFTEAGLARLHDALAAQVNRGAMPGLAALVARRGQVHVEVIGTKAFGDTEPLGRDAIFRIASLTKPVAAVAAMMLVDDGVLHVEDPVDALLPELANRRVLRTLESEVDDTLPARRPITIEDLLTFRLGFGSIMAAPGTYPIQAAVETLDLKTLGEPWPPPPHAPDEWIRRFGTLPLLHQPGERWMYNTGAQVLGVLLERAAGRPLDAFLRERVFEPLGMRDSAFSVPEAKLHRFTTAYAPDPQTGALNVLDDVDNSWWHNPPALPNAAGWLVGTLDDYWSFARLLSNNGVHDGARLLSERSVARLTTDHLTAAQRAAAAVPFLGGHGWGYGMMVPAARDDPPTVPGGYGWDGGTGTTWRTDRDADLTCILLTQRAMTSPEPPEAFVDFFEHAYAAVAR